MNHVVSAGIVNFRLLHSDSAFLLANRIITASDTDKEMVRRAGWITRSAIRRSESCISEAEVQLTEFGHRAE